MVVDSKDLPNVSPKTFLKDHAELDEAIVSAASGALKDFRKQAMHFIDDLLGEILQCQSVSSDIGRGLSCFSADVLVGGDDDFIFKAFGIFVRQLHQVGRLSSVQVEDASNEFKSFVVDVRSATNNPPVENIADSLAFILSFPSVFAKKSLLTVSIIFFVFIWALVV